MKLELIDWTDSAGYSAEWTTPDEALALSPIACQTVGWVVNETEDQLVVAASKSFDDGEHVCGMIAIPKSSVMNRTTLTPVIFSMITKVWCFSRVSGQQTRLGSDVSTLLLIVR